ncbi:MAG: hypothetical protein OHK0029_01530 [Armatimonadaceae bacterium]
MTNKLFPLCAAICLLIGGCGGGDDAKDTLDRRATPVYLTTDLTTNSNRSVQVALGEKIPILSEPYTFTVTCTIPPQTELTGPPTVTAFDRSRQMLLPPQQMTESTTQPGKWEYQGSFAGSSRDSGTRVILVSAPGRNINFITTPAGTVYVGEPRDATITGTTGFPDGFDGFSQP